MHPPETIKEKKVDMFSLQLYFFSNPISNFLNKEPISQQIIVYFVTPRVSWPVFTCILSTRHHHYFPLPFSVSLTLWFAVCPLAEVAHLFSVGTDFKGQATSVHLKEGGPNPQDSESPGQAGDWNEQNHCWRLVRHQGTFWRKKCPSKLLAGHRQR